MWMGGDCECAGDIGTFVSFLSTICVVFDKVDRDEWEWDRGHSGHSFFEWGADVIE